MSEEVEVVGVDPYAPPQAPLLLVPSGDLFGQLRSQGTWRLLGLGFITIGVYYAHYCARQARIIDQYSVGSPMPKSLTVAVFVASYLSLALLIAYLFVDEGHPLAVASNVSDRIWMLLVMIWGFCARSRVNTTAGFTRSDPGWFNGGWTFLFSPLYFNYKVNKINEAPSGGRVAA